MYHHHFIHAVGNLEIANHTPTSKHAYWAIVESLLRDDLGEISLSVGSWLRFQASRYLQSDGPSSVFFGACSSWLGDVSQFRQRQGSGTSGLRVQRQFGFESCVVKHATPQFWGMSELGLPNKGVVTSGQADTCERCYANPVPTSSSRDQKTYCMCNTEGALDGPSSGLTCA